METSAGRRRGPITSCEPVALLIVGIAPDSPLGLTLRKAFPKVQHCVDVAMLNIDTADLAVGIFSEGHDQGWREFAALVQAAGVPALSVLFRSRDVLIGPVWFSGKAGCGGCAFERLRAASAAELPTTGEPGGIDISKVVGQALVREMRTIMRRGPQRSQLLDHVLALDGETEEASLHKVIPLSHCRICGGAASFSRPVAKKAMRLSSDDSLENVLGALAGWVDRRTGIISSLFLESPHPDARDLPFIVTAAPPHIVDENGALRRLPLGWGKGLTASGAILSAVGESIERYSASLPDPERIVWKRPADLDGEFFDPGLCALYAEDQYVRDGFPYVRFDPDIIHPWILGKWLGNDQPVWVPAVFAFLSLTIGSEQLICQGTSNGLAASTDPNEAALRAMLELVERDAFLSAWRTGRPGRRVALDETIDPLLRRVVESIELLGATVEIYALPTGVCGTTILCLSLGDGDTYPGAVVGLGADLHADVALRQAILELAQTGPYLQRMMQAQTLSIPNDDKAVQDMRDHAAYYFPSERATAFDRLRGRDGPISLRELGVGAKSRSLKRCLSQLQEVGVRVAVVDVTSADVATGPFRVMRAVSPDLQPLSYGYGLDRCLVPRIRSMGLASDIPAIHPIW